MSNRRKIGPRETAQALGRIQAAEARAGDYHVIEAGMDADLALMCHCLKNGEPMTIVIGVKNWAHAGACIGSPFFADDLTMQRKLFEIVPMREAPHVRHPLDRGETS